jgi:hypothetical protein
MHRRTASSPGAYLDIQPMNTGDYSHHTMTGTLPNQVPGNSSYPVRLPESVEPFVSHDFSSQDLGQFGVELFPMDSHNAPYSNYNEAGNMQGEDFHLNPSFTSTVEDGNGGWEQIEASRRL